MTFTESNTVERMILDVADLGLASEAIHEGENATSVHPRVARDRRAG